MNNNAIWQQKTELGTKVAPLVTTFEILLLCLSLEIRTFIHFSNLLVQTDTYREMWSPFDDLIKRYVLWIVMKNRDHSLIRSLNNVYVHNFKKNRKTKQVKRVSSAKFRSFGSRRMYSFIFGCEVLLLYVVVMSYHLHCVPKENYNVLFYGCWLLFLFAHYPFPYLL